MFQNSDYQREVLAYQEKIALAKLEESKAAERVKELEYQKARFDLEFFLQIIAVEQEKAKSLQQQQQQG
jgi:hypothetical protein